MKRHLLIYGLLGMIAYATYFTETLRAQEERAQQMTELRAGIADGFTQFQFGGAAEEGALLSRYLWYHFDNRAGHNNTLFNKEYILLSDMWVANAKHRTAPNTTMQEIHRADLLNADIDENGYVSTHQHFSHAHNDGWPFPMWPQSGGGMIGFHFQSLDKVPGWTGDMLRPQGDAAKPWVGEDAIKRFELQDLQSSGMVDNVWKLTSTGPEPMLTTPDNLQIDAFQSSFMGFRWSRSVEPANHALPYIEWKREGDVDFSAERRFHFSMQEAPVQWGLKIGASMIPVHEHPLWDGKIQQIRIALAPGASESVDFTIDSFYCAYDTRHTINNPILIMASYYYFGWTGDLEFMKQQINRLRFALRYMQTELGGLEHNLIRNTWVGHDGRPGWKKERANDEKAKIIEDHRGHGIGNNYWDLLPFGWDDFYATYQYYRATLMMAEIEEAIAQNPGWDIVRGANAMDPAALREHAAKVKQRANSYFWNPETGRFYPSVTIEGERYDYGLTLLNLDAIWYDIVDTEHAKSIMEWLNGDRIVAGDTSQGKDIYHWRFGPRATTRRNIDWYGQGWTSPESIPWGGQVQDGGAVLGFSFYDMWARLKVLGADNAWNRLKELLAWDKEAMAAGGYRAYYEDGSKGTTLQGGGTAGGLGIDAEFFESSLVPSIAIYGFMGMDPKPTGLLFAPQLPSAVNSMKANILYHFINMDVEVTNTSVELTFKDRPAEELNIMFKTPATLNGKEGTSFQLIEPGTYKFTIK